MAAVDISRAKSRRNTFFIAAFEIALPTPPASAMVGAIKPASVMRKLMKILLISVSSLDCHVFELPDEPNYQSNCQTNDGNGKEEHRPHNIGCQNPDHVIGGTVANDQGSNSSKDSQEEESRH